MTRFDTHLGFNYNPEYLTSLSDEELIELIDECPDWDMDLLKDLVWRASCKDDRIEDLWGNDEATPEELFETAKATLSTQEGESTMTIYGRKITQEDMDTIATYMDDEIREHLNFELAPCSPEEFLRAYIDEANDEDFMDILRREFDFRED